jgi:hypothetical protein
VKISFGVFWVVTHCGLVDGYQYFEGAYNLFTILRIYGLTCENGVWRIKYNNELYGLYEDVDIVRVMKVARIRWLRHLIRMEENSPCKKITFSQPEGSRKKGRPKLRWLDSVLKDVKLMKVETWWKKALDMNIYRRIIKEAKVHTGL